MNRGYKIYFKEGKKAAALTLKNKGNYLRFYAFLMVKILSIVLFPLYSLVRLAEVRLTKSVKDDNDIEYTKSLKSSDSIKNYWTMYVADGFKFLYVLGNILVIALGTGLLYIIGFSLEEFISSQMRYFDLQLSLLFAIPGAVVLVVYLLTLPFKYVPNAYIVDSSTEDVGASKTLYYSFNALKKTGKKTLFASYFMQLLFNALYIGLVFVVWIALSEIFIPELSLLITILVALPYIFVLPKISLVYAVLRYCLYEDVVYDQLIANKKVSGIAIKDVTTAKKATPKQMLNQIFSNEDTEEQEIAKMSALLNMKNLYKVEEKTPEQVQKETEEKILATPVEEFDLTPEPKVEETTEFDGFVVQPQEEVHDEFTLYNEIDTEPVEEEFTSYEEVQSQPVEEEFSSYEEVQVQPVKEEFATFEEVQPQPVVEEFATFEEVQPQPVVEEFATFEEAQPQPVQEEFATFEELVEPTFEELETFEEIQPEVVEKPKKRGRPKKVVEEPAVSDELELFDIENEVE